jgi:hypothetical protein
VDPRACLDYVEKTKFLTLPGLERRTLGCTVRSQPVYRLRYPGSYTALIETLSGFSVPPPEIYFSHIVIYMNPKLVNTWDSSLPENPMDLYYKSKAN